MMKKLNFIMFLFIIKKNSNKLVNVKIYNKLQIYLIKHLNNYMVKKDFKFDLIFIFLFSNRLHFKIINNIQTIIKLNFLFHKNQNCFYIF